ncbi:sensor histidine kinase [Alkalitalea saponilacus]|uniref:histidine kinase n=1 Tax=Alkalitalea saponilacus TaxID=889453 RepID=A0A1T5CYA2_9BACT|nr:ATP-binding protein [Alkalitalea saponilacus]ASB50528.1 ATP-binding protein [Alkalitalea saponilacus]SKB64379.1 Histidine kinase-, DNA gyrase B-, and HSP90-like ATPase [Alkalitalea saponilacus]
MIYKLIRNSVIWRVSLVVLASLAIGFLLGKKMDLWMIATLFIITIWMLIRLVKYIQQPYKKLHYFIESVKNDDTSTLFSTKTGNAFLNALHSSLNNLNRLIQEKSIRVRMAERYFSEILQHIDTAVLVFNEKEFVLNSNKSTLQLLGLNTLTHLRQLDKVNGSLRDLLLNCENQKERTIHIRKEKESMQLIVRSTIIRLRDETVTLVTMQDIKGELERKELDSWLKLIRVLNHEIMNSLTPVTSIAQSLGELWKNNPVNEIKPKIVEQTINGLDAIEERGDALMRFVESYRLFSRMPDLRMSEVSITAFFDRTSILISPMKEEKNVSIQFYKPDIDFNARMDEQLMLQVIINLIKNSIQALNHENNGKIEVSSRLLNGDVIEIIVVDNGSGIPDEIKDEIFVPFFTTREEGSGIGLSYSRQILRAHGGSIGCNSVPGRTEFYVRW